MSDQTDDQGERAALEPEQRAERDRLHRAMTAQRVGFMVEHPPSATTGEAECNHCGLCCHNAAPCVSMGELARLARAAGLEPREFFAGHCVVDLHPSGAGWRVKLANRAQVDAGAAGGVLVDWRLTWTFSPCVMWDGEARRCSAQESKPRPCRAFKCWVDVRQPHNPPRWSRDDLAPYLPGVDLAALAKVMRL